MWFWLALAVICLPGLAYTPKPAPFCKDQATSYSIAGRIYDRSEYRREVSLAEHRALVSVIWKRGKELGLTQRQRRIYSAMVYVESGFRHDAREGDSYGPAQVRRKYQEYFEAGIDSPEYHALPDGHPAKSVWLGLAAYKIKLEEVRGHGGTEWGAVRFYNGRGRSGFHYLWKVRRDYARFFGHD